MKKKVNCIFDSYNNILTNVIKMYLHKPIKKNISLV